MARLLEHDALTILAEAGIQLPRWEVAASAGEAEAAAARLGDAVVLKALVPVGGRAKAGAIRMAADATEAGAAATELLARRVGEFPVRRLLVMERLDMAQEQFVSFTFDPVCKGPVLLYSCAGGMDVEAHAGAAGSLARRPIHITRGLRAGEFLERLPRGLHLGYTGALIEGDLGRPSRKKAVLREAGVRVAEHLDDIVPLVQAALAVT